MRLVQILKKYLDVKQNSGSVKRQYIAFVAVGAVSFVIGILLLKLFYKEMGLGLITSNTISFIIVSAVNFVLSIKFVFIRGKNSAAKEITLFYITAIFTLLLDNFLLDIFVRTLEIYYVMAKILTVSSVSIASFLLRKFIVFKK
ncbi:MAG: GtrA family protein [Candidatus Delongbacteria bacterium]|nr:GtrA family protein [Candidatus Delongbacteria bacterium]